MNNVNFDDIQTTHTAEYLSLDSNSSYFKVFIIYSRKLATIVIGLVIIQIDPLDTKLGI